MTKEPKKVSSSGTQIFLDGLDGEPTEVEVFGKKRKLKKILKTVLGSLIVIIGIILLPLPGPGMLIIFLGMTMLGDEYDIIKRFNARAKEKLDVRNRKKNNSSKK